MVAMQATKKEGYSLEVSPFCKRKYSGLVGLAITYALSFTNVLNSFLTSFIETEKELVSVERVSEYIDVIPMDKQSGENDDDDENEGPPEEDSRRNGEKL
jgi:hypothetical protein